MLQKLSIRNYILIESIELTLPEQLLSITGETGAGKSILLGAIGLLTGDRADTKVLLNQEVKCVIEGEFIINKYNLQDFFLTQDLDYEDVCFIRREINPNGKSRAFVNDTPITVEVLKQLGGLLMDIHSQNDTFLITNNEYQLHLIDRYGGWVNEVKEYQLLYKKYIEYGKQYETKKSTLDDLVAQQEYYSFLQNELEEAAVKSAEDEVLEAELKALQHAEDSKVKLQEVSQLLDRLLAQDLKASIRNLQTLVTDKVNLKQLEDRMRSVVEELSDIQQEAEKGIDAIEYNPERIQTIQDRLSVVYALQKKHKVTTTDALLTIFQELSLKKETTENLEVEVEALFKKKTEYHKQVVSKANYITQLRQAIIGDIEKKVQQVLVRLFMPDALFSIQLQLKDIGHTGENKVQILFSANKGKAPSEIKQVASGGEFSRVVLALKYVMAEKIELPTLIFDEIDTGVSGEVALQMGYLLKEMSATHQTVLITHLPQIAAMGNIQWMVKKKRLEERTLSDIEVLNSSRRVQEIAKMIGGDKPSAKAIATAKEFLEQV
ncbi:MAG: DNA repair protein RecN [Cytophagaceae bacterium]|jgi:DNA repair protein RecN (Recombination protein N)|nr:DNA repair protein RecN [Cytophagaceae bacterium]